MDIPAFSPAFLNLRIMEIKRIKKREIKMRQNHLLVHKGTKEYFYSLLGTNLD